MSSVVGIFRYSGDADLAADHLRSAYALTEPDLEVLGAPDSHRLRPADPTGADWQLAAGPTPPWNQPGDLDLVARRWGYLAEHRDHHLVVARTHDEDQALAMAADLVRWGAEPVDIIRQ